MGLASKRKKKKLRPSQYGSSDATADTHCQTPINSILQPAVFMPVYRILVYNLKKTYSIVPEMDFYDIVFFFYGT